MILIMALKWWYGLGWRGVFVGCWRHLAKVADHFSIGLLLRTLFLPFRQISANETSHEAGSKLNLIVDKLISRIIGLIIRSVTIITGIICLALVVVWSLICLAIWPLLPVAPVCGIILMLKVGVPWKSI